MLVRIQIYLVVVNKCASKGPEGKCRFSGGGLWVGGGMQSKFQCQIQLQLRLSWGFENIYI